MRGLKIALSQCRVSSCNVAVNKMEMKYIVEYCCILVRQKAQQWVNLFFHLFTPEQHSFRSKPS